MNAPPRPKILVVDDTPANLVAMRRLLAKVDAELVEAGSGNAALAACIDHEFALILLDVQMPDIDGFEVAALLEGDAQTRGTPIIFVTAAYADDLNRLKGYGSGAVDYIAKPVNDVILLSKVRVFLDLYRSRQLLRRALSDLNERNAALEKEIAERKRVEEVVRRQATHDGLTGLPNRMHFMDRLEQQIAQARDSGTPFALFYVDLDGFKPVNDQYGHYVGDLLLQAIALRLGPALTGEGMAARLGGDEFALILPQVRDRAAAAALGATVCAQLSVPHAIEDAEQLRQIQVGASVGAALFDGVMTDAEALMRAADAAMYQAKRAGKNHCVVAD